MRTGFSEARPLLLSAGTGLSKPQEGAQTLLKMQPNDRQKGQIQAALDAKSLANNLHSNLN